MSAYMGLGAVGIAGGVGAGHPPGALVAVTPVGYPDWSRPLVDTAWLRGPTWGGPDHPHGVPPPGACGHPGYPPGSLHGEVCRRCTPGGTAGSTPEPEWGVRMVCWRCGAYWGHTLPLPPWGCGGRVGGPRPGLLPVLSDDEGHCQVATGPWTGTGLVESQTGGPSLLGPRLGSGVHPAGVTLRASRSMSTIEMVVPRLGARVLALLGARLAGRLTGSW